MLMFKSISISLALLAGIHALDSHAQSAAAKPALKTASPVEVKLERRKVVVVDGKEFLDDATSAKPGDVLQDLAVYTNNSKATVSKLEATLPVPANTELIPASVKPSSALASTDGINFSAMPLRRKVKSQNGVEVEQAVPVSAYRFLRWYPGDLGAGKSLTFSARFKVADDKPASAANSNRGSSK